jgi:hypothetical protein
MFFIRITEWGWDEAPAQLPMFAGDLPRQDHPLPKALDDTVAAKLLHAAQADRRILVGVTVEVLRVGEYTALPADALVLIGGAPWLHGPVHAARDQGLTWTEIGQLLGLSPETAARYQPHP